jgi:hypothetical protein
VGSGGDEGREGKVESNGLIPARFAERVKGVRLASAVNVEWGCDTKDVQKSRSQTRPQDFPQTPGFPPLSTIDWDEIKRYVNYVSMGKLEAWRQRER